MKVIIVPIFRGPSLVPRLYHIPDNYKPVAIVVVVVVVVVVAAIVVVVVAAVSSSSSSNITSINIINITSAKPSKVERA